VYVALIGAVRTSLPGPEAAASLRNATIVLLGSFGVLTHQVAKLRTAEDVRAGVDTHPEPIWSSNVHKSDAVLPELGRVSAEAASRLARAE
jgi:hypothetical protein